MNTLHLKNLNFYILHFSVLEHSLKTYFNSLHRHFYRKYSAASRNFFRKSIFVNFCIFKIYICLIKCHAKTLLVRALFCFFFSENLLLSRTNRSRLLSAPCLIITLKLKISRVSMMMSNLRYN